MVGGEIPNPGPLQLRYRTCIFMKFNFTRLSLSHPSTTCNVPVWSQIGQQQIELGAQSMLLGNLAKGVHVDVK